VTFPEIKNVAGKSRMLIIDSSVQNKKAKRIAKSEFFSEHAILGTPNSLANIENKSFKSIKPPIPKQSPKKHKPTPDGKDEPNFTHL